MRIIEFWSPNKDFAFRITDKQLAKIQRLCAVSSDSETGGILVGHYDKSQKCAIVTDLSKEPLDSQSGRTWFKRGIYGLQKWLNRLWKKKHHYYLGEWHYHPHGTPCSSRIDVLQMREIAEDVLWRCPEPLMLIVSGSSEVGLEVQVYLFQRGKKTFELMESSYHRDLGDLGSELKI